MNKFFIIISLIISTQAFSYTSPNPCAGYYECTDTQLKIWDKFKNSPAPNKNLIPAVYSGGCFHLSSYYRPEDKHFGVVMLDSNEGNLYNYGKYGFYYETNPYEKMTVEDFRNNDDFSYSPYNELLWEYDGAMADYSPSPDKIWRYYFKQDELTNNLLVVGIWTPNHLLLCELKQH